MSENIEIYGAEEHNLKNIDIQIPRNRLVVFTGLSGSGKSSLAFDTIFAEGQRRYIETFSSYARQFLSGMDRPKVDKIEGLSPVISIEQKTVSKNPRSTVGTITEVYDFMRLLFARLGTAYSYVSGEKMVKYSDDQIVDLILKEFNGEKVVFLAPLIKGRKGHYRELFEKIRKKGFTKVRVDGEIRDIKSGMKLDRYKIHDIEMVVDRVKVDKSDRQRLKSAVEATMKHGDKSMMLNKYETEEVRFYSRSLMCPTSGISYPEPEPNLFSFNSPYGACSNCSGLGEVSVIDMKKIIPDPKLSIKKGGLAPLGKFKRTWIFDKLGDVLEAEGYTLNTPLAEIPEEVMTTILYGREASRDRSGNNMPAFEGVVDFMTRHFEEKHSRKVTRWAQSFMNKKTCPKCEGSRLNKAAHYFKIEERHIGELVQLDIVELAAFFKQLPGKLSKNEMKIGKEILKEINDRLSFILAVGLDYLTLNRSARTLSGGEGQRIRLATQIGSELMNVLYVLDEPSIGLHQRDNTRLIDSLKQLRDAGNSVIVVEHDREMIESADFIVDIGPGAGVHGGAILSATDYKNTLKSGSLTAQYLNNERAIPMPEKRRKGNKNKLVLKGASGHNLKNVKMTIPLGTFTCVTGVSGSGKSTLINQTLYPILNAHFYKGVKKPLPYKKIEGLEALDKVIEINQSPIGRTPRSNPATYTKVFDEIRSLFARLPEAQIRGYKPGRFSFNVKGGRCETCKGGGLKQIEMNFLPDVYVECETCKGKRYNRETLEVRYKGQSIFDVLDMTIDDAEVFFEPIPKIHRIVSTLKSVGLGYVKLGQPSTTLSGGEAQRIKLAAELAKRSTGKTIYILDEPSTGLHFEDIRMLLDVLNKLVEEGNTVLVIEHNLDIVKFADYIIDIGPEGGSKGGSIVAEGKPEEIVKKKKTSHTAKYLAEELKR
ncbi:MAG: excinuclease ABC subunit UvrA [Bacteroidota bacterium]